MLQLIDVHSKVCLGSFTLPSFFMMSCPISVHIYSFLSPHSLLHMITGLHACDSRYQRLSVVARINLDILSLKCSSLTGPDDASWPPPFPILNLLVLLCQYLFQICTFGLILFDFCMRG